MLTKFIEATDATHFNHGKFMVGWFEPLDWTYRSEVDPHHAPLLDNVCGWTPEHIMVMDIQTGEGGVFKLGGLASADLNEKHQIWVCPMYEPFLTWLYKQHTEGKLNSLGDFAALPPMVNLGKVPVALYGHRRPGNRRLIK